MKTLCKDGPYIQFIMHTGKNSNLQYEVEKSLNKSVLRVVIRVIRT